ncbi:MAG TPA: protein kinase [Gemmataceae bacterium]|nr:protein kinase [Gemmataceae bacterium]
MTEASTPRDPHVSVVAARRADQICDGFEAAWNSVGTTGQRPRIEDFVADVPEADRSALLRELILVEIELRCRAGDTFPRLEEYQARFPVLESEWLAAAMAGDARAQAGTPGLIQVGQLISHYRIEDRLGSGGMGVVYKAHDTRLDRRVALKFLPAEYAPGQRALERFRREALMASALNHPHICTILDIDTHQDRPFLVMELIQGCTLRQFARQRLALESLVQLGEQVARALAAAHAAGIVHRDIKPENVMVREDGYAKVVDFGLARPSVPCGTPSEDSVSEISAPGTLIGTPRYMSPEQGRAEPATNASDIFALGIMLYELSTGHHPFEADSHVEVLHAILSQTPVPSSRLNPEVPAPLETLLQCMLEKDPQRRPNAAAVAEALAELNRTRPARPRDPATAPGQRHSVGRQEERAALHTGFESAASGKGLVLCVAGEPGIGKTTLVEDFLQDVAAEAGAASIARGRCSERLAGAEAYLPFLEALDSLVHGRDGEQVARILKVVAPTWYIQLAPVARDESSFARVLEEAKTASQERLKRELTAFLQELSRLRPVILFIDDTHWADVSTVDLLAYIGSRCSAMRLLLVLAYRPADLLLSKHPFLPVKLELQGRGACREMRLAFLSRPDIDRYLALEFPEHDFSDAFAVLVHARTEGNPLFVVALLRYLRERGIIAQPQGRWTLTQALVEIDQELPESVRSMIQRKIDQLSEDDRRLLIAASVQGQEFDAAVVAKAIGREAADIEERLDVLECVHAFVRRVVEKEFPNGTLTVRYRFVHVLYQNALYAMLVPARRASLSGLVAQTLLGFYGDQCSTMAAELALLFETAREFAPAADHFLVASQNAARVYANQEAVMLARRTIAIAEKLPGHNRYSRVLAAALHLGPLYQTHGQFEEEMAVYELAETAARETGNVDGQIQAICGMAMALIFLYRRAEARAHCKRALELAQTVGSDVGVANAETVLGFERVQTGALDEAEQYLERAIPILKRQGPSLLAVRAVGIRGAVHRWRLEYDRAENDICWALEHARRLGTGFHTVENLLVHGMLLGNKGRLSEALELLQEGMRLAELNDERFWLPRIPNTIGWVHREMQAIENAVRLDTEGAQLAKELCNAEAEANSRVNLGHDYLALAEPERALEQLQEAQRILEQDAWMRWRYKIRLEAELASYAIVRGDLKSAAAHTKTALKSADASRSRKHSAWAHKLLGDIAALEERVVDSQREYAVALSVLERHPCPVIEWKILKAAADAAKQQKNDGASAEYRGRAMVVVQSLAATIRDDKLRQKFLAAKAVCDLST